MALTATSPAMLIPSAVRPRATGPPAIPAVATRDAAPTPILGTSTEDTSLTF